MERGKWCKLPLFQSSGLLQHCSAKGDPYHRCVVYYLDKLNIQRIDQSIFDGNRKQDVVAGIVDENEGDIIGFVIDRHGSCGATIDNNILRNVESNVENCDTCVEQNRTEQNNLEN